ncbi:NAD(P)H-binding protein [Mycolicibacterium smegmatis]|uniref:NAD(P)-binding domain-containing protein n=1 Tax=Mycolicibacterium smegmatis (strain MKD8) TaxID=1214915 RepID=A0A2U9PSL7_MYCSE|nr:NAD(P)H-binding protein [Mycolicibacterium smegmatis]AWT54295.1 hypothetical protein D806_033230 [Mycolicibacterium smegmatis MKD8]
MTIRTVLVVGAAGNAAGHVVTSLAEKEVRVRGFIRDAEKRQQVLRRGASEVAVGDLNRVEDVKAALSDVDAVFYVPPAFIRYALVLHVPDRWPEPATRKAARALHAAANDYQSSAVTMRTSRSTASPNTAQAR